MHAPLTGEREGGKGRRKGGGERERVEEEKIPALKVRKTSLPYMCVHLDQQTQKVRNLTFNCAAINRSTLLGVPAEPCTSVPCRLESLNVGTISYNSLP